MVRQSDSDLLYFAYGSNMLTARLRARAPSARPVGLGWIGARRLVFHKLSVDGSGKCDILVADGAGVHGVLFEVGYAEVPALDRVEGGYRRTNVVIDKEIAFTYLAERVREDLRPYHWYKALVVAGAREHGLPADYVAMLEAVESIADPDAARRAANLAFL